MMGIGTVLLALGVADLVAGGWAGQPKGYARAAVGMVCALVTAVLLSWLAGFTIEASAYLVGITLLGGGWLFLRVLPQDEGGHYSAEQNGEGRSRGQLARVRWALGFLTALMVASVVFSGAFRPRKEWISRSVESIDVPWIGASSPAQLVLMMGTVVFLLASANGVVRAVLDMAGTEIERSEQRLRGGRFIGAIERLLIYGLAVVGEPTAAALIVSAKSLLRFPELSEVARRSDEERSGTNGDGEQDGEAGAEKVLPVDSVTEYFLLGSLVSWFVALALALLALEPGDL